MSVKVYWDIYRRGVLVEKGGWIIETHGDVYFTNDILGRIYGESIVDHDYGASLQDLIDRSDFWGVEEIADGAIFRIEHGFHRPEIGVKFYRDGEHLLKGPELELYSDLVIRGLELEFEDIQRRAGKCEEKFKMGHRRWNYESGDEDLEVYKEFCQYVNEGRMFPSCVAHIISPSDARKYVL